MVGLGNQAWRRHRLFLLTILWQQFNLCARGLAGGSVVKNPSANAGNADSIPGLGRSPRETNGNPLQYSCLENPMDRGGWWAPVLGVTRVWHHLATKPWPPPVSCPQGTTRGPETEKLCCVSSSRQKLGFEWVKNSPCHSEYVFTL